MSDSDKIIKELQNYMGEEIDECELDEFFKKFGWICMGFNRTLTKLIYIESPMGEEIDLNIKYDNGKITIKNIRRRF